jgi:hypothetical protein
LTREDRRNVIATWTAALIFDVFHFPKWGWEKTDEQARLQLRR